MVFEINCRNCFVVPDYHDVPAADISLACCAALSGYITEICRQPIAICQSQSQNKLRRKINFKITIDRTILLSLFERVTLIYLL